MGAAPRRRGFGVLPDQQAFGGLPNAMLAFHTSVACTAPSAAVFSLCQFRHTRSTLRNNRFHRRRWDNYPISVSAAKTCVFVHVFTVIRKRYTVTLNHKCRHPQFYRHPPQTKINRRFLNFGCRYGKQFLPTAGFRFYCHPIGHKRVQVFANRDFCAY